MFVMFKIFVLSLLFPPRFKSYSLNTKLLLLLLLLPQLQPQQKKIKKNRCYILNCWNKVFLALLRNCFKTSLLKYQPLSRNGCLVSQTNHICVCVFVWEECHGRMQDKVHKVVRGAFTKINHLKYRFGLLLPLLKISILENNKTSQRPDCWDWPAD